MRIIIIILLITLIRSEITGKQAFKAFNELRDIYRIKEILPHNANIECKREKAGLALLGGLLFALAAPFLAPLAAAPGLYGAAAFTNGLATLGFGSLAAGGFGMAGGLITLGITGITVGYTLQDCDIKKKSYDYIYDDKGKLLFEGTFTKTTPESGKFYLDSKIFECNWEFCKLI